MAKRKLTLLERLLNLVSPDPFSGCWLWTGAVGSTGYGCFRIASSRVPRSLKPAHRVAYELLRGPIPALYELDHLCKVPTCVNPRHLEPVSRLENIHRSKWATFNADKTHCPRNHPYSPENTRIDKKKGGRLCRTCKLEKTRESRALARLHKVTT